LPRSRVYFIIDTHDVEEKKPMPPMTEDYQRIEKAILFLEKNFHRQPDLHEVAQDAGLSAYHFQRLFRRWAGISPKRFVRFLTLAHAKQLLEKSRTLLDATYDAGLSSPGRLHDLFVNIEAMTPGEFKARGAGLKISYGFHPSPFGECWLAATGRGVCGLGFVGKGGRARALRELRNRWKEARWEENPRLTRPYIYRIFSRAGGDGGPPSRMRDRRRSTALATKRSGPQGGRPLRLLLKGTNFQIKVWEALLKVPRGALTCYEDLAAAIGRRRACRAVGAAVGRNPVAFIIPCHRVIRKVGMIGDYHWGAARKKAMLAWEAARTNGESE
jgi:AraC family transcriptional regulator of adaptative response/methylated-DNA-[protein]-cysteine methyltransferase